MIREEAVLATRMAAGRSHWVRWLVQRLGLIAVLASSACGPDTQLDAASPYARLIGAEYRIVGDVDAHGVYAEWPDKKLGYITLIPGVGIGGRDIAFRRRVPRGQIIRILSAWMRPQLIDKDQVYYVVSVDGSDLPSGIPVLVELIRGNEGVGAELNSGIYERRGK